MLRLRLLLLLIIPFLECQLHDLEVTTPPSWAPTGRLNQFNGFATPRPSLLPANAQMVYASVWAAWSAWSFCSDSHRIRVRACNTVRGFRCLGPNQQTEACDPATSPILGRPPRPNTINPDDYDSVDPWQEDRVEALKQLYPDETIDEKLSHLPDHEKERLRARLLPPPSLMSHELLNRPVNEQDGAPGATPEKMFGARPKVFGARTFAVPNAVGGAQAGLKDLLNDEQFFSDITNDDKKIAPAQQKLEDFGKLEDFEKSVDAAEQNQNSKQSSEQEQQNFESFEKSVEEQEQRPKSRGEGTFTAKNRGKVAPKVPEAPEISDALQKLSASMDGPEFSNKGFTEDIFGSIEELMSPPTTTTTLQTTTTRPQTTKTTTTPQTTTTRPQTTKTTTTPQTTTTRLQTTRRPPIRVTPRLPTVIPEDTVELVTPSLPMAPPREKIDNRPEMINFFEEEMFEEDEMTTRKPWKNAIHYGEVIPQTTTTRTTPRVTTTQAPPPAMTTQSGFPIPEEISLDTLHALDWMLANMTKAAEEGNVPLDGNELRLRLDSSPSDPTNVSTKLLAKKPRRPIKKRVKTQRTKTIKLHYGDVLPADEVNRKFPKFRNRNAHRARIFGIKTSSIPEETLKIQTKKSELTDEINDLRDLMEQMDERIESRSALMEDNFDRAVKPKHEHNSPYRHRQV
ncbi:Mucin-5AC [Caenorhabditis elegans]|uniref:Mucin-5AC n=1 Tax=Caenorhabditis elegans TaxID=6239 RepID=Q95XL6_CAEEL|nr:Mucin-5AC [Caenorhabditis elegans]CCD73532.2 Mucin-5AC [Caenorhabditis elegans]|eukprot:NP_490874.2 Uncharacterized protein CELE_Y73E7A.8 [Caenorhabditis elegans]